MEKTKKKKNNLDAIIKVLEAHNINSNDLKKLNELQIIKQKNLDIIKLLTKLESGFKSKKINYESALDTQKRIFEILKDVVPAPAKRVKKNKNSDDVSDNKEDLEKNTNL